MIPPTVSRLFDQAKRFVSHDATTAGAHHTERRHTPSSSVVWAWEMIQKHRSLVRTAVDAGCGRGRNSLFLARQGVQVTALDFMPGAIAALKAEAQKAGLQDKIRPLVYDVTEGWPVTERGIDLVIDAFCFKHITGKSMREAYKINLVRALDVRGLFMIAFASVGDGYYGKYITEHVGDGSALCLDPVTNLQSVLFTREHVVEFFAPEFRVLEESTGHVSKPEKGSSTPRLAHALLFHRNAKSQGNSAMHVKPEDQLMKPRFYGQFKADDR